MVIILGAIYLTALYLLWEVVGLGEVFLLHISHNDKELYEKLVDFLTESGYQINHLHNKENQTELLQFKELEIIPERHQVFLNEQEVVLTGKEFQILMLLARNRGRVFSKEQIYDLVWGNEYVYDSRNMTAYINKIRKKIEPDPARTIYILTVWGVGYKFNGEIR